jgi:hypothetical protein
MRFSTLEAGACDHDVGCRSELFLDRVTAFFFFITRRPLIKIFGDTEIPTLTVSSVKC